MKEQSAGVIPVRVVTATLPDHWRVRGVHCFASVEQVTAEVQRFVGMLDTDVEWTTFEYKIPSYLVYSCGNAYQALNGWPGGVFLHRFIGGGCYEPDPERLDGADRLVSIHGSSHVEVAS